MHIRLPCFGRSARKSMIFSVYPDEHSQVEAGGQVTFAAVALESEDPYEPVADGTCIDWRLDGLGEDRQAAQSTTKNGVASLATAVPTTAGIALKATAMFRGQSRDSALLTVIPNRVTTFELRYNPLSATEDFIPLQVYCTDRFGNAANPEHAIWWRLRGPFRIREVDSAEERSYYPVCGIFTVYIPSIELQQETSYPLELLFEIDDVCKEIDLRTGTVRDYIPTYLDPITGEVKPCSR